MNQKKNAFTINSRKFDGVIHRSWKAELIEQTESLLTFAGRFEKEITHPNLGVIRRGTMSYEFYWTNRWYNIFRFHEPEGDLRNFYCNVNQPPVCAGNVLDYVDLDIDVLVWKDLSFEILDLDEFKDNSETFNYSTELKNNVNDSLNEILNLIKNKSFPFNIDA
ncbi:MAG: DUF402 domain-containing protein [Acidobacteriota bacterium]|nr:DUF402 domain-containing protein [Acidobacteriota bacterium]